MYIIFFIHLPLDGQQGWIYTSAVEKVLQCTWEHKDLGSIPFDLEIHREVGQMSYVVDLLLVTYTC